MVTDASKERRLFAFKVKQSLWNLDQVFHPSTLVLEVLIVANTDTDPRGRAVYNVGLRPLACWDCGVYSRRGHVCVPVVSVVCYHVVVSTTDRSFIQRIRTECGVCECGLDTSAVRRPWSTRAVDPWKVHYFVNFSYSCYHELAHLTPPPFSHYNEFHIQ